MTTKEALEYARIALWSTRGVEAFAVLTGLAEENERLQAESNGKHWQGIAQIAALQTENAALKAEVEILKREDDIVRDGRRQLKARAEKAEAELERARPLLEAVEKAETFTTEAGLLRFSLYPEMKGIIEKALAYREAKVKP
jgi:hypothetical protein